MRKYIVLAFVIVLVYFFQSFFLPAGGAGADSLSYFGIASELPQLKTNLFPLGFPVLIKLFHSIFQDYLISIHHTALQTTLLHNEFLQQKLC